MEHFFPRIQAQTFAQMHTRVKLLEGMQVKNILKLLVGIQSNYWGNISPPGFGTPAYQAVVIGDGRRENKKRGLTENNTTNRKQKKSKLNSTPKVV